MQETILTITVALLGIATVMLSLLVCLRFYRQSSQLHGGTKLLTRSLSFQLFGEAIIGLGTLLFAIAAFFGWLDNWSVAIQSIIRLIMFFATAFTTLHLFITIQKMRK